MAEAAPPDGGASATQDGAAAMANGLNGQPQPSVSLLPTTVPSLTPSFSQLCLRLERAKIVASSGLLKPNPYCEVIVDGKPSKRTEIVKSTYNPKWGEAMTLLVTPYSKILFRLYDHSVLKKDALLGENTLDLFTVLKKNKGKCESTAQTVDLFSSANHKLHQSEQSGNLAVNVGSLYITLDGMSVDMSSIPVASPPVLSVLQNGSGASSAASAHSSSATSSPSGGSELPPAGTVGGGVRPRGAPANSGGRNKAPPRPAPPVSNGQSRSSRESSNRTSTGSTGGSGGATSKLPPLAAAAGGGGASKKPHAAVGGNSSFKSSVTHQNGGKKLNDGKLI